MTAKLVHSEAKLTFVEAASIIVGHGVGSGILSIPYLASRNSLRDIFIAVVICYGVNLVMHFMIAELSLNNHGAQFIECFKNELFTGKRKMIAVWCCFLFLGISVLVNISGFIVGSAVVFTSWFGLPETLGIILYYVLVSIVMLYGMKLVGIMEKFSVGAMGVVVCVLFVAVLQSNPQEISLHFVSSKNVVALYSMIAFSLSAVMSVPQVVKGLDGNEKQIRLAIAAGTGFNTVLMFLITFMTLASVGSEISTNGAFVDLASHIGNWTSVIGYIFSLLALSTSFWANALNLRDIVHEQTHLNVRISYLICTIPSLILALTGLGDFVGFTRMASVVQILTGIGIIMSYHKSRKRMKTSMICGFFGTVPFQAIVIISSILSTIGALIKVL